MRKSKVVNDQENITTGAVDREDRWGGVRWRDERTNR